MKKNLLFWSQKASSVLPMPPNSGKQAFAFRKFSNRSKADPDLTKTTTDEYLSESVSEYKAAVKL
jgi:hypothetical protein